MIRAPSGGTAYIWGTLLLASYVFFLWMFLSAESVEQMAAHGQISGRNVSDIHLYAARFAARWKHGMAGNSPLYMPGFFAVGILVWLWSIGRPIRRLVPEGLILMAIALPIAALLAPQGAIRVVNSFEHLSGFRCSGAIPGYTVAGVAASLYTLITWSTGIFCVQLSIAARSIKPIWVPVIMNVILLRMRPWAVNDYVTQWVADICQGMPTAILSLLAVPVVALLLTFHQLGRQRNLGRQKG